MAVQPLYGGFALPPGPPRRHLTRGPGGGTFGWGPTWGAPPPPRRRTNYLVVGPLVILGFGLLAIAALAIGLGGDAEGLTKAGATFRGVHTHGDRKSQAFWGKRGFGSANPASCNTYTASAAKVY